MSSSSSVSSSTVNGVTRVTGLSSGLDVDSIVSQLMTAEKTKLNRLKQKEQLAEWRQTAYRDVISDIQDFTSTYFDLSSSTSILKQSNYNQYTVTSSNSAAVSATYTSAAASGSHTISVSQLATAATLANSSSSSKEVQGSSAADYSSLSGKSFKITLDGTSYTVDLSDVSSEDDLQTAIDTAVGSGKIDVGETDDGYLTFTAADDSGVQEISISAPSSGTSGLSALGFGSGAITSNRLSTSSTLSDISSQLNTEITFNDEGQVAFTINGTSFTFDSDTTLSAMISKINSSDCGATMSYDELSGELKLTADTKGAGNTLVVSETDSNFLTAAFGGTTATAGIDAKFTVDGTTMTRSSNTVTVNGVTYTLNAVTSDDVTVNLTYDSDAVYDLVSNFVDAYNDLISNINDLLDEDYDSDYPPLTEDQEDEMSDTEISSWNAKAKTGLLEDDSLLTSFLSAMRSAMIDSVSGSSVSFFSLGLSTGTYDENGKIYIDEDTLKSAISSDPEAVMNFFTQQSTDYSGTTTVRSLDSEELSTRYDQEGLAYRLYDTLAKYTSTYRDDNGNKGLLIEKAGIDDDSSDTDNSLSDQIDKYESAISDEEDRLDDYEDNLYDKYSTLETYINTMNSQLSALSSYLSS